MLNTWNDDPNASFDGKGRDNQLFEDPLFFVVALDKSRAGTKSSEDDCELSVA
jgi:hypothetical protein